MQNIYSVNYKTLLWDVEHLSRWQNRHIYGSGDLLWKSSVQDCAMLSRARPTKEFRSRHTHTQVHWPLARAPMQLLEEWKFQNGVGMMMRYLYGKLNK